MKVKTVLASFVLAILPLATGCGGSESAAGDGRELVVASFYPLAFAAQQLGGGALDVRNLTPAGAEPHDLEVSPGVVRQIDSAELVLVLGHGFQPELERAAGDGERVLRLLDTSGLDVLPNGDPHVWLDPLRYAVIAEAIGVALGREKAARALAGRLRELDGEFRRGLSDCQRREIVTSHKAFAYLAQRYRLEQVAITGLSPEAEPAPRELERVVARVHDTGATTVFYETLVSPGIAETVAREAGVTTAVLNPIEGLTADEADRGADFFSLMHENLAALRRALGCR
jgi:zinc transport system substrate-binding protein